MITFARAAVLAATIALAGLPRLEAQTSTIRVTLSGGQNPGTHAMKGDDCQVVSGEIRANFTPTEGSSRSGPVSVDFYTVAGKGKPNGFGVKMIFLGEFNRHVVYEVHAMPPGVKNPLYVPNSGSGTVTVRQTATGQTATFRGQTKDGVKMEGTVDCRAR